MAVTQNIPNTQLNGQRTFNLAATTQPWSNALLTIDRTVTNGLNSAPQTTSLTVSMDYSTDGGANWLNVAGATWLGGVYVTKGVTLTQEQLGIGIGHPFPVGTAFRVSTNASAAVTIAGTVVYG